MNAAVIELFCVVSIPAAALPKANAAFAVFNATVILLFCVRLTATAPLAVSRAYESTPAAPPVFATVNAALA